MSELFSQHKKKLKAAINALHRRDFFCAYPENESAYDEIGRGQGEQAFNALLGKAFDLGMPEAQGHVISEHSPYGLVLDIAYPVFTVGTLVERAESAYPSWAARPLDERSGLLLEIVERLNRLSFVMAHAIHHTTGQGLPMAFQAGGPHAQDRAVEAIALCYRELSIGVNQCLWRKGSGRHAVNLSKDYRLKPCGVGLVIACATFPNWNSYAAIFANLMTGNSTIIKPHPLAVLPLALTVKLMRETLQEFGADPDLVQLAVDNDQHRLAPDLAIHPEVKLVDFTGSPSFGSWLRDHLHGKRLYTEEAGLNSIVIESTGNFSAMCRNIAFSLTLYSGQMCTTPQNIFIPRQGIETDEGNQSADAVMAAISKAVDSLLSDPVRATHVCGALYDDAVAARIEMARGHGIIIRDSSSLPGQDGARTATPLLLSISRQDPAYRQEWFGPISFFIPCDGAEDCVKQATATAREKGAITAALYSVHDEFIDKASLSYVEAGVALSVNLTGAIWVNQSAAFSDYHVSGANPSGNATLTDTAYIAGRFHRICIRRQIMA